MLVLLNPTSVPLIVPLFVWSFVSPVRANLTCTYFHYNKSKNVTCEVVNEKLVCETSLHENQVCREGEVCLSIIYDYSHIFVLKHLDCFMWDKYVPLDGDECVLWSGANNFFLCQCNRMNCNANMKYSEREIAQPSNSSVNQNYTVIQRLKDSTVIAPLFASIVLLTVGVIVSIHFYRFYHAIRVYEHGLETSTDRPSFDLVRILSKSNERCIWLCKLNNSDVCAKVFSASGVDIWRNEVNVYKTLCKFESLFIPKFLDSYSRNVGTFKEYIIFTEYSEIGSLFDYLRTSRLSLKDVLHIAQNIAEGLEFLHTDSYESCPKLPIAHRDVKSKNILLRRGLDAFLSDFGLSLILEDRHFVGTQPQVGTLRYMAPELIEGAVSMTPSGFTKMDIYSLALVFWELISRCYELNNTDVYLQPYEKFTSEISQSVMYQLVVVKKTRPRFEEEWLLNPVIHQFAETIEDCWDHDAEGRLSSACVVKRLKELYNLIDDESLQD